MLRMLVHWALSALALGVVSKIVPGFAVGSVDTALVAVLVIGLVNATLGMVLKILTFPLTLITLGLFWFVINALMIELAAHVVPGFYVANFGVAFVGGIVLTLVNMVLRAIVPV